MLPCARMHPNDPMEWWTIEGIEARLRTIRGMQCVIAGMFALIVLAWIVLGYWTQAFPVFISTVVIGLGLSMSLAFLRRPLVTELRRRKAPI